MALQYSETVRNAQLDALETAIGTGAPANCAAAITGTVLVSITLPSDWMAGASSGSKAKSGTWQGTASGTGTADFWRLFASDGTTCHAQGTATVTGGGGDLTVDNASIASSQVVTVSSFSITAGNA